MKMKYKVGELLVGVLHFLHGALLGALVFAIAAGQPFWTFSGLFIVGIMLVLLWYFKWLYFGKTLNLSPVKGRILDVLALPGLWISILVMNGIYIFSSSIWAIITISILAYILAKSTVFTWMAGGSGRFMAWISRVLGSVTPGAVWVLASYNKVSLYIVILIFLGISGLFFLYLTLLNVPVKRNVPGAIAVVLACMVLIPASATFLPRAPETLSTYRIGDKNKYYNIDIKGRKRYSGLRVELNGESRPAMALPSNHSVKKAVSVPPRPVFNVAVGIEKGKGGYQLSAFLRSERGKLHKIGVWYFKRDKTRWEDIRCEAPMLMQSKAALIIQVADWSPEGEEKAEEDSYVYLSKPGLENSPPARAENVILVVFDSMRADHLSHHGYQRNTSPYLENLSRKGVVFENAYSASSYTTPSVATLLTGKLPSGHGVTGAKVRLARENLTLPECLDQRGYHTAAISANPLVSSAAAFEQGFDEFHHIPPRYIFAKSTSWITRKSLNWIKRAEGKQPFFLYLHYFDPHWAYTAMMSPFGNSTDMVSLPLSLLSFTVQLDSYFHAWARLRKIHKKWILNSMINRYDGEILRVDRAMRKVLGGVKLNRINSLQKTLLVLTSDHGEEFMEHNRWGHGYNLYNTTIHVPLIIIPPEPSGGKRRITRPVSLADLPATLLEESGSGAEGMLPGENLLSGKKIGPPSVVAEHLDFIGGNYSMRSVIEGNFKLIINNDRDGPVENELYNLETDYREKRNLAPTSPHVVGKLIKLIEPYPLPPRGEHGITKIRPEEKEKLKALGYLR